MLRKIWVEEELSLRGRNAFAERATILQTKLNLLRPASQTAVQHTDEIFIAPSTTLIRIYIVSLGAARFGAQKFCSSDHVAECRFHLGYLRVLATVKSWLTECWSPALQSSSWSSLLFPLLPTTKNSTKRRKNTPSSISDFSWHFRRSNNLCTPRKSREDAECSFSYTLLDFKVWNLFTSNIWIHHKLLFAT